MHLRDTWERAWPPAHAGNKRCCNGKNKEKPHVCVLMFSRGVRLFPFPSPPLFSFTRFTCSQGKESGHVYNAILFVLFLMDALPPSNLCRAQATLPRRPPLFPQSPSHWHQRATETSRRGKADSRQGTYGGMIKVVGGGRRERERVVEAAGSGKRSVHHAVRCPSVSIPSRDKKLYYVAYLSASFCRPFCIMFGHVVYGRHDVPASPW
jgi:hypothetical protein